MEVLADLIGHHGSLGPGGPTERDGERPRPRPGLQDPRAEPDVRGDDDRPHVLRVDHLGPSRHLEHEVAHGRAQTQQPHAHRRVHRGALLAPQDQIVGDHAPMEVERIPRSEPNEEPSAPGVGEQDALARLERCGHDDVTVSRPARPSRTPST